ARREPDRDGGHGQGDEVDQYVEGLGQQREAVRNDRGNRVDDEGDPGEPERDEEPAPLSRSRGRRGKHDSQRYRLRRGLTPPSKPQVQFKTAKGASPPLREPPGSPLPWRPVAQITPEMTISSVVERWPASAR